MIEHMAANDLTQCENLKSVTLAKIHNTEKNCDGY